ncbi:hypothetical protein DL766_001778 [Monosporascus sp. MC13-8B]|uniref:Developmental regulatory protein wetA n=1 Tax=Monosporascus cannonballus TaxID=155416 RepID=A0ABY0HG34_9PEZI|nr:hypothetical protein DL762_001736 [Monosporascus cannonballus]RYO99457.1 hypothetical protein DL763_001481 [Monosporascus cannonballus]RYP36900.1 hypothetical protein DL766_001778 [Monosporascus sp. MC13-8B]
MAFTAVHYPMDKDQGQLASSYWPDNDELGVASDNFFDQFVTFDAGDAAAAAALTAEDLLEDPPSPSILIDSLKDDLANLSSNDQDHRHLSGNSRLPPPAAEPVDDATAPTEISPREAAAAEDSSCAPADLLAALTGDPILGGSISDSELLRLEGISLRSPKANVTAPSSPPLGSSSSPSPRKHSRFVESVYATIRRAAHHRPPKLELGDGGGGSPQQHMASTAMNGFKRAVTRPRNHPHHPQSHHHQHHNHHHPQYAEPSTNGTENSSELEIAKHEPVGNGGLPLSPPLTGTIPTPGMRFVSGHLDDPFCEGGLCLPAHPTATTTTIQTQVQGQDTPMHTPDLHSDVFYQQAMAAVEHANDAAAYGRQQQPQRPKQQHHRGRTAEWPMDELLTAHGDPHLWSSASPSAAVYIPDGGGGELLPTSPGWWETHHHQQISSLHLNGNRNHNPQDHDREQHQQTYEYDAADGFSGLMIHMPRPRQPPPAVLSATDLNDAAAAALSSSPLSSSATAPVSNGNSFPMPTSSSPSASHHHHHQPRHHNHHAAHTPRLQHYHHHHRGYTEQQRRPRPRAPSSGARHHGSATSPRKLRHSSSRPYLALREESTSPTPTTHHGHPPHARSSYQQQPRSASSTISVRKRRSWCKRTAAAAATTTTTGSGSTTSTAAAEPRTPSSSSSTFNYNNNTGGGGGGGGRGRSSSAGGCGAIDFVNFTPSDKNVLMTGVAPSGSSKTKARREREALDRQRKLSEATIRAVREAGGDVDKFIEQGFWLGGQAR